MKTFIFLTIMVLTIQLGNTLTQADRTATLNTVASAIVSK